MNVLRKAGTALSLLEFWLTSAPNGHSGTLESVIDLAFQHRGISPIQRRSELLEFARIVERLRPKTVLEIGTCNGGTLLVLCRLADPTAKVISIDLPGGKFGGGYEFFRGPVLRRMKKSQQKLHLFRADSHKRETQVTFAHALESAKLDLLFIDGDHTYEGVRCDFEMYSQFVRSGGIIAFHDIVPGPRELVGEVSRFWTELKSSCRHREIVEDPRQPWGGIGVLFP
jgi:predicted O-methyltransferase YrrM